MTEWYYVDIRHERQGPVSPEALTGLYRSGALTSASLAWREGMNQWTPLGELAVELGIADTRPVPASPAPAAQEPEPQPAPVERPLTGRAVFTASEPSYARHAPAHASQSDAVAAAAAATRAVAAGESPEAAASPYAAPRADMGRVTYSPPVADGHVVYAGFWKRVAASFIDAFAIGIPVGIVATIIAGLLGLGSSFADGFSGAAGAFNVGETAISYVLSAMAYGWFHSAAGLMATPGKLAIGIKVVRADGDRISFLRGFARYWATILSAVILGIGFLMAAFTSRKQALHDLVCDTLVVDKWAFTSQPGRQREELGPVALAVLIIGGLLIAGAVILMLVAFAALFSMSR
ncbi:RDD family protein [Pseudoxanthomonas sp. LARHCG66]|jgi:uncharacterized RDD family membrane protein YckC